MAAAILSGTLVYTRPIASTTRVPVLLFGARPAELGPQTARKPLSKQGPATPPYVAAAATSGRHVTDCPPQKAWEAPGQARKPCAKVYQCKFEVTARYKPLWDFTMQIHRGSTPMFPLEKFVVSQRNLSIRTTSNLYKCQPARSLRN